jgi:hypothetical protein
MVSEDLERPSGDLLTSKRERLCLHFDPTFLDRQLHVLYQYRLDRLGRRWIQRGIEEAVAIVGCRNIDSAISLLTPPEQVICFVRVHRRAFEILGFGELHAILGRRRRDCKESIASEGLPNESTREKRPDPVHQCADLACS